MPTSLRSGFRTPICLLGLILSGIELRAQEAKPTKLYRIDAGLIENPCSDPTPVQGVAALAVNRASGLNGSLQASSGYHGIYKTPLLYEPQEPCPDLIWVGEVSTLTGNIDLVASDLSFPSAGAAFVVGRSYNQTQSSSGYQGTGWFQTSQPEMVQCSSDNVRLVIGSTAFLEFARAESGSPHFQGVNGAAGVFTDDAVANPVELLTTLPGTWTLHDPMGGRAVFIAPGGDTGVDHAGGQRWYYEDAAGNKTYAGHPTSLETAITEGFDAAGRLLKAYDPAGRRYTFTYSEVASNDRLASVVAETKTSGDWHETGTGGPQGVSEVGRVDYAYYETDDNDDDDDGADGCLKMVTVTMPLSDSGVSLERKTYYRYYTGSYSGTNPGHAGNLKLVLEAEAVRRFGAAALDTASDEDLKAYASSYLTYGSTNDGRVKTAMLNGQCGCGSGGAAGTYSFRYDTLSGGTTGAYDRAPRYRTVGQQPDGLWVTRYFDEAGQILVRVTTNTDPDPSVSTPTQVWIERYVRNDSGAVIKAFTPEANTGFTYSTGVVTSSTTEGEVRFPLVVDSSEIYEGLPAGDRIAKGDRNLLTQTPDYLSVVSYLDPAEAMHCIAENLAYVYRPLVSAVKRFPAAGVTNPGSSGEERAYTYEFWSTDTATNLAIVPKAIKTTYPAVTTANNGSNAQDARKVFMRTDGTVAFEQNEQGVYTYTQYVNGQLIKRIDDCQTNASYPAGDDPNGDFGITEGGVGKHLVTEYAYDAQGRLTKVTLPDSQSPSTRVTEYYYSKLADGRAVMLAFPRVLGTTYKGPVSYTVVNLAGNTEFSATLAIADSGIATGAVAKTAWVDEASSDPVDALHTALKGTNRANVYLATLSKFDPTGRRATATSQYHQFRTSAYSNWQDNNAAGAAPAIVCDTTSFDYDNMGRTVRVKDPTGTINRTVFDAFGRAAEHWVGTDDTGFNPPSTVGDMVRTERRRYDGQLQSSTTLVSGKNSRLTSVATDPDGDWSTTADTRETGYTYDYRGRVVLQTNPDASPAEPHAFNRYDNLDRLTESGRYSSTSGIDVATDTPASKASGRVGLTKSFYDERGRIWKAQRHKIDPDDGSDDDSIATVYWFDPVGRLIKVRGEELRKTVYDRLGRPTHRFVLAKDNDSSYGDVYATGVTDLGGDTVLAEYQTFYEDATGNALFTAAIQRHHDEPATTLGRLDTNGDGDPSTITAANIQGRIQTEARYYDTLNRLTHTVQYGTNGIVGDGFTSTGSFTRPSSPLTRSSTGVIITSTVYHESGAVLEYESPTKGSSPGGSAGARTRYEFDRALRRTATIANYENGSLSVDDRDHDVYTRYAFSSGLQTAMWVDIRGDDTDGKPPVGGDAQSPADDKDQVTRYVYGVVKTGTDASKIASNRLMYRAIYPPQGSGQAESDRDVLYSYNALGQQIRQEDQAGVVVEHDYDAAGRVTHRRAATVPTGFDTAVRRISSTYGTQGFLETVTQYDNAAVGSGAIVDQIKHLYDGWSLVREIQQDPNGTVGGTDDYIVQFVTSKASPSTGRVTLRRDGLVLQSGGGAFVRTVNYQYGATAADPLADAAGRVSGVSLQVGGVSTTVAEYAYTGTDWLVRTDLPQPSVYSSLHAAGASKGAYDRLDGFNRAVSSRWTKDLATDVDFYRVDQTHDRNSNVIVADETGHVGFDFQYTMDGLDRLKRADGGTWNGSAITSRARDFQWMDPSGNLGLSQTGNWTRFRGDYYAPTNTFLVNETRVHNAANEILTQDYNSNGVVDYTATHNLRGEVTDDGREYKYEYDAFGRVTAIRNRFSPFAIRGSYRYNGLGYRTGMANSSTSSAQFYFAYDDRWRSIATFRGADTSPKELFVYHNAGLSGAGSGSYIDSVILRDRDANGGGGWTGASDGTLEERRYYCQNWRADVVALITSDGQQLEQVRYDPYGAVYGLLAGDADSLGNRSSVDVTIIQGWANTSTYDVRGDMDLDGDVDATDVSIVSGMTKTFLGGNLLSREGNRKGWAGYEFDDPLGTYRFYHVRNRLYHTNLGRWTRRDPLGYTDGPGLLEYSGSSPFLFTDPYGLERWKLSCFRCIENIQPTNDPTQWYYRCYLWDQDDPSNFHPNIDFNKPPATTNPPLNIPATGAQPGKKKKDPYGPNLPLPPGDYIICPGVSPRFDKSPYWDPIKIPKDGKPGKTPSITQPGLPPGEIDAPGGSRRNGLRCHGPGTSTGCMTSPMKPGEPFYDLWIRLMKDWIKGGQKGPPPQIDLEIIEGKDCSKESPIGF